MGTMKNMLTQTDIEKIAVAIASRIQIAHDKRWLKLKDAAHYSSIGEKRLKELAKRGLVQGYQDEDLKRGDWVFDRHSLDKYWESQLNDDTIKLMKILK